MSKRATKSSFCEEIIIKILVDLPVKTLMRFKCVSKDWLRLIKDPYFVGCHRARSHTRFGGIQLLYGQTSWQRPCILTDPEGNVQSDSVPLPTNDLFDMSNAEGLICFGKRVWNPSTRESIDLPPAEFCSTFNRHYLLGFDAFTNRYKVVSCGTNKAKVLLKGSNIANQFPEFQVMTLGDESWRRIPLYPEELRQGFEVLSSRSFSNMIFCFVRCGIKQLFGIITLDVQREHVGYIPLPADESKSWNWFVRVHLAEIEGRLAFMGDDQHTLWVLNHEIARWTKMEITLDGCPNTFVCNGREYVMKRLIPVGTFDTNEILFQCNAEIDGRYGRMLLKYFYYDPETKKIRFVPKLDKTVNDDWHYLMMKHIDSLVILNPPKGPGDETDRIQMISWLH